MAMPIQVSSTHQTMSRFNESFDSFASLELFRSSVRRLPKTSEKDTRGWSFAPLSPPTKPLVLGDYSDQSPPRHKSSRPVSLLGLLKRQKSFSLKRKRYGIRSCLKNGNISRSIHKKSVQFATNTSNDKVWTFVKPVDLVSHESHDVEALWYTPDDFDRMLTESVRLALQFRPQAVEMIRNAARSSPEMSDHHPKGEEELINDIALRVKVVSGFPEMRGLERMIFKRRTDFHKDSHLQTVLSIQEVIREEAGGEGFASCSSSSSSSSSYDCDDIDLALLRKKSMEWSRASRLTAVQMAEFDAAQALEAIMRL